MTTIIEQARQYYEAALKRSERDAARLKARVKRAKVPEGWTANFIDASFHSNGGVVPHIDWVLTSPEGDIAIKFHEYGSGSTTFQDAKGTWRTFDRRGIEESFYWASLYPGDKRPPFNQIIEEQIARVAKVRDFYKTSLTVPDIGHQVSPETLKAHTVKLKKPNSHITFTPSGFGTGYTISNVAPKVRHQFGPRRASSALEGFFDVSPLWVETFDCD